MLDPRFLSHNSHLEEPASFRTTDPTLRALTKEPLVYRFPLLAGLPRDRPGIYCVTGGRQVGKTTVLKQWMADLLARDVHPQRLAYLTGELIDDHHSLVRHVTDLAAGWRRDRTAYLIVDEVTYISGWDKGVKFLADAGTLESVVVVLTGSDAVVLREARVRFPGRRGSSGRVDFHLGPLTFHEYVSLSGRIERDRRSSLEDPGTEVPREVQGQLDEELLRYFRHGGYLRAINDMAKAAVISLSTFATYCDWIRGDMLKRGKQEQYLREILGAIVKRYGSQVTWNNLAKDLSIDHPMTVADYVELLRSMDAVFVQPALLEDKLAAAPKKPRRLHFTDPFILHAVRSWLRPEPDPFASQVEASLGDPEWTGRIAESCAVTHVRRFWPTFYIKAEGEVDIAYVDGKRIRPVEVKWTEQLRPKDLKQIAKSRHARIWAKSWSTPEIQGVPVEPLPLALYRLGPAPVTVPD